MVYYNEQGVVIPEEEVDLDNGYLVDRTVVHHDEVQEVSHIAESAPLNADGATITRRIIDTPYQEAYDEVTEQTYIRYPQTLGSGGFEQESPEEVLEDAVAELSAIVATNTEDIATIEDAVAELSGIVAAMQE